MSENLSTLREDAPDDPEPSDYWYGYDVKSSTIYTGLVHSLRKLANENDVTLRISDQREKPEDVQPFETNFTMRDYQEEAVRRAIDVGRGSMEMATGGGKTIVCLEVFARLGVRGVVIVPTQVIWGQFIKTAARMYAKNVDEIPEPLDDLSVNEILEWMEGNVKCPIGVIGRGQWDPKRLTIAIAAGLDSEPRKCREYLESIDWFWSDEHHHASADTWFRSLMRSDAYHRYGGSGTVYRTDGQDLKIFATTGPIIHTITATSLIEKGWLAKPRIKMVRSASAGTGKPSHWANYYRANILYNRKRTSIILSLIANSIENNIRTLCLVAWGEHARNILARISSQARGYIDYVESSHGKRQIREAISRFAKGEVRVLIATPLLSEGYDLCTLDRLIRASAMKSPIRVTQETGRVLRIEDAPQHGVITEVWDFYDTDGGPLTEHSRSRKETWESEEAFDVEIVDNWAQPSFQDYVEDTGYLGIEGTLSDEAPSASSRVLNIYAREE